MIVLGLLFMGAATAALIGVVAWNQDTVGMQVFGHAMDPREASVVFVAGVIAGIVFAFGLSMVMSGMARGRHRRKERRRLEKRQAAEERALRERNAELERKLATERSDGSSAPIDLTAKDDRYVGEADRAVETSLRAPGAP